MKISKSTSAESALNNYKHFKEFMDCVYQNRAEALFSGIPRKVSFIIFLGLVVVYSGTFDTRVKMEASSESS